MKLLPIIAAALLALGWTAASACELRVRRNPDPLVFFQLPNGEVTGPQLEILREALRRLGCGMQLVEMPWARALLELEAGHIDVLPGAHRRPERERYALFSQSDWPSQNRLFVRRAASGAAAEPESLASFLQSHRLGLQVGVSYGLELEGLLQAQPQLRQNVDRVATRRSLWKMLALGRVDGVLADAVAGAREVRELDLGEQVQAARLRVHDEPSHTAFSRKTLGQGFVKRFDEAIKSMQADGSRAAIEQRFQALFDAQAAVR